MGYVMDYAHPSEIMDEMRRLTPMLAGVSFDRLEERNGLQWPVPSADHPGTPLMHADGFPPREGAGGCDGRARFVPVEYLPPGEEPNDAFPFILITGRILQHYNCGAQTRRTDIMRIVDADVLEMHPEDAARLHLTDGESVKLVSARGEAILPVTLSQRVQPGQLFTSFHFPGTNTNALLSSSADESSKCPEYKVSAVRVEALTGGRAGSRDAADDHARWRLIT